MKQSIALDILKTGQNVFLTGQAGAGKTYVLNQYINYLRSYQIPIAITASTGIAATHVNGMTIHAWAGMGIKDSFEEEDYKRLKHRQSVIERILEAKVLIVDEISMLHAKQVDLLDDILRTIRQENHPFGGVQVIFSGDFFQLPPVGNKNDNHKEKYAFMAKAWASANFQICYLSEQHRQSDQDEQQKFGISLNQILNQIRNQDVDQLAIDTLLATKNHDIDDNCIHLYTHNANVDDINQQQLNALKGKAYTFECTTFGDKILTDTLAKNVRANETLTLKVGAKVMFVKNNKNLDISNGTMGKVIKFSSADTSSKSSASTLYPVVQLSTGRTLVVEPEEWVIEDNQGEVLASYSQVPLCLAWAITVHKSQGMTLDVAKIDLSHTFEAGQGYVALSRLRSLEGLKLLGLNNKSLFLDEWVFRVDKRLIKLSQEHQANFETLSSDQLKQIHQRFIDECDGIKIYQPNKKNSHEKT